MGDNCCSSVCTKCKAGKYIVFGAILFIATWWAKSQGNVYFIWYVLAGLVILKGVMKLAMPHCPHCAPETSMKKKK